jgi:outer membrane biosynthesis protein TonB
MAKHEKQKAGLHKGISSIFKGVSIPQADGDQEPSGTSAPERTDYTKPKPLVPVLQKSEVTKAYQATQTLPKAAPGHTDYTGPKQPTPEPQKTQAQKSYQVTPSLPKAATAQQSKAEPAQRPKAEPVQKPKAEPTRQPKADIDKKVSKKSPTVKISSQSFLQQIKNKLFKPKSGVSTSTTKQKAMVVMMPLLFIVLIFMLSRGGVFGTSAGRTEASTEDTAPGVVTAGAYTKIDWEIPAPYPTTLRDPMRLVPVEIPQAEISKTLKLIVKGILYSEDNPSAVIGNQIVHEGETIRGVSVIKISQDSVEFEMNGKRWTQKIRQ